MCNRKIKIQQNICKTSYWESEKTKNHFEARVFPLDKGNGKARCLIITSKIINLLECYLTEKLKKYCNYRIDKNQYGFSRDVGI